ncbi:MAG: glycosyltransferase, partial [Thermoproteus sp.]|nr:glycosyltransferase [Thermoproteus sp.]
MPGKPSLLGVSFDGVVVYHSNARSIKLLAYALAKDLNGIMMSEQTPVPCHNVVHMTTPTISTSLSIQTLRRSYSYVLYPFLEYIPHIDANTVALIQTSKVFTSTNYIKYILEEYLGAYAKVVKPRIPIVTRRIKRPRGVRPSFAPFACFIAANAPHKNITDLLNIALKNKFNILVVSGPGFWYEYNKLCTLPNVKCITNATSEELNWVYHNCGVYLALSHAEGLGMPPLEAAYRGIPVVASDIPPYRETLSGYAEFVETKQIGEIDVPLWSKFPVTKIDVDYAIEVALDLMGKKKSPTATVKEFFEHNELANELKKILK